MEHTPTTAAPEVGTMIEKNGRMVRVVDVERVSLKTIRVTVVNADTGNISTFDKRSNL